MRSLQPVMRSVCVVLLLIAPTQAAAQLEAHFEISSITYYSSVAKCDVCLYCTPTCELYLQMGVFSSGQLQGSLAHYPGGCSYHELEGGTWNFADQEIARGIPDLATNATLYIGLFDDDPDEDDLLGTHYESFFGPASTSSILNNNSIASGYSITDCEEGAIDFDSYSSRYSIAHSAWFTDATPPSPPGDPEHYDDVAPLGWDYDDILHFSWAGATDDHSEVSEYQLEIYRDQQLVTSGTLDRSRRSANVCYSGCDIIHQVVNGSSYSVRIRARNGHSIELQNQAYSTWSAFSDPVIAAFDPPVTTINSPVNGSWQNSNFSVSFTDTGDGLVSCEYTINGGGWLSRICNDPVAITVGSASENDCQVEGSYSLDVCVVQGRSTDAVGLISLVVSRRVGIDYTGDSIPGLEAFTEPAGTIIAEDEWTADRDPTFTWIAPSSAAPIVGYSYAFSIDPDCTPVETSETSVSLPADSLSDGVHSFRVRLSDIAANCGPVADRTIQVDGTPDAVDFLGAYTEEGGEAILSGLEQDDNTPFMEWVAAPSVAPIAGFSFDTGASVDCSIDTSTPSTALGPLSDGTTTFWVRVVDEAGNCGVESTFDIVVLQSATIFSDGFETGNTATWSSTVP